MHAAWQASEEMVNSDGAAPPFLRRLVSLVKMGIVANKMIDLFGFKYAIVTSLAQCFVALLDALYL